MASNNKIALVIGWGSVKCAASLGLLRVLLREGIEIDMVVASGGGSIFGSKIAMGDSVEDIVEMNQRLWTHKVTEKTNRSAIFQILLPKIFKARDYFHLRDDHLVNQRLREAFGESTFADTKIPLFITATEYKTGKQAIISTGSIYEAVRASIALPLIFPPFEKDDLLLADGYLSEPLPIGVAIKEGATIILAMGFESISTASRNSIYDYALHLSSILSHNLLQASIAFYNMAHHAEIITVVPQFKDEIHMFDTHKIPEIIKAGESEAEKVLPSLYQLLELSK